MGKDESIEDLQTLRNIGPAIAEKLYSIGIKSSEQMKKSDPETLYKKMNKKAGKEQDRCLLYVFRGAIHDVPWPKCKD